MEWNRMMIMTGLNWEDPRNFGSGAECTGLGHSGDPRGGAPEGAARTVSDHPCWSVDWVPPVSQAMQENWLDPIPENHEPSKAIMGNQSEDWILVLIRREK